MPDKSDFKPFVPEKKIECIITRREAVLIAKLRRYPFGKFTIHKMNNVLVRVEINDSQLIDEDTEVDIS